MGQPTPAEQIELAKLHCPDLLTEFERLKNTHAVLKSKRKHHEQVAEWVLRMRKEIAAELIVEFWEAIQGSDDGD